MRKKIVSLLHKSIFGLRKSIVGKELINPGFIDWHSHILPGVDDGVQTMEDALSILQRYEELGVSEVWLTPHIMEDIPNTTDELRQKFTELQSVYTGHIQLHLGAENMLDHLFDERLAQNDLLPIGDSNLLVETSYFNPPISLYETLRQIKSRGYIPILAHPERYMYMDEEDYYRLKEEGVKFQLNLFSLEGLYGQYVCEKAKWLKRKEFYDYIGTDIHNKQIIKQFLK